MSSSFSERLKKLNTIGISLSEGGNRLAALEQILEGAKELTHADGGIFFSVTDARTLRWEMVRIDTLAIAWGGSEGDPVPFEELPLYLSDSSPNREAVSTVAATTGETVVVDDAYQSEASHYAAVRTFDQLLNRGSLSSTPFRSSSFLTVPMKNHEGDVIAVLQLVNAVNQQSGAVEPFSDESRELVESLASQGAVVMTSHLLVEQVNALLEGFIRGIADAIDAKSPHTGGHCRRVPVIADLLAKAVNRTTSGVLADDCFTDAELYELQIAALLHDCGKVTTPVHIVDKKTRLETVTDRIELINLRLEVLLREQPHRQKEIEDARRFIEECNLASTYIDEERANRLKRVACWTWGEGKRLITDEELDNLLIDRGTLNTAERAVVENHVVSTIQILDHLPYPKHLRAVPEIAGSHHEKMDGSGYPRHLKGAEMSLRARILVIADIFEALTAPDRPYKKMMSLSEALTILTKEKECGKIDAALFDVFMNEHVYLSYAADHLPEHQIDVR